MLASLGGDAAAYRALLDRLSRHLRRYYKRHLVRSARDAEGAEVWCRKPCSPST
jgi:RNA polymerase sigma-70 factor (ECF subfamily)